MKTEHYLFAAKRIRIYHGRPAVENKIAEILILNVHLKTSNVLKVSSLIKKRNLYLKCEFKGNTFNKFTTF